MEASKAAAAAGAPGGAFSLDLAAAFSLPLAFRTVYHVLGILPEARPRAVRGSKAPRARRAQAAPTPARHTRRRIHNPHPKDGEGLSKNVAVRTSGSSTARDAASAQVRKPATNLATLATACALPSPRSHLRPPPPPTPPPPLSQGAIVDYMRRLVRAREEDCAGADLIRRVGPRAARCSCASRSPVGGMQGGACGPREPHTQPARTTWLLARWALAPRTRPPSPQHPGARPLEDGGHHRGAARGARARAPRLARARWAGHMAHTVCGQQRPGPTAAAATATARLRPPPHPTARSASCCLSQATRLSPGARSGARAR